MSAAEGSLRDICITVSSARVAGVFLCDFAAVQQQLHTVRQQLSTAWQDPCHFGVLSALKAAQALHQAMYQAMQVQTCLLWYGLCMSTRLSGLNVQSHGGLASCEPHLEWDVSSSCLHALTPCALPS